MPTRATRRDLLGWAALAAAALLLILVPFVLYGARLETWAAALAEGGAASWITAALLAGLLAADVLLPVPSSLLSTACGALFGLPAGALVSWAGMTAGALLGYALGQGLGQRAVARAVSAPQAARASALVSRYGMLGLVVCRGVPVLAEASVLLAGSVAMPAIRFAPVVALSNLGLSLAYAWSGAAGLGHRSWLVAFLGAAGVPALAYLVVRLLDRHPRAGAGP